MRRAALVAAFALAVSAGGAVAASGTETGDALLADALHRRYGCDLMARLRLTSHGRGGETRLREVESVTKRIDGRAHALARVLAPAHLRGMTLLAIEGPGRADDVFVHLPSLGRTRRVIQSRRSESFLGTDLSWADLERHRAADYRVSRVESVEAGGALQLRIVAHPTESAPWQRVDFLVDRDDLAILGVDYFERDGEIRRTLRVERASIRAHGLFRIPTRLVATDHRRGTRTEARVVALEFEPAVPDGRFGHTTLDAGRPLSPR